MLPHRLKLRGGRTPVSGVGGSSVSKRMSQALSCRGRRDRNLDSATAPPLTVGSTGSEVDPGSQGTPLDYRSVSRAPLAIRANKIWLSADARRDHPMKD
jgi:hypothetical protein